MAITIRMTKRERVTVAGVWDDGMSSAAADVGVSDLTTPSIGVADPSRATGGVSCRNVEMMMDSTFIPLFSTCCVLLMFFFPFIFL